MMVNTFASKFSRSCSSYQTRTKWAIGTFHNPDSQSQERWLIKSCTIWKTWEIGRKSHLRAWKKVTLADQQDSSDPKHRPKRVPPLGLGSTPDLVFRQSLKKMALSCGSCMCRSECITTMSLRMSTSTTSTTSRWNASWTPLLEMFLKGQRQSLGVSNYQWLEHFFPGSPITQ